MGFFSKSWSILCGAAGIAVFSQAPEFTQQYNQRLGGGINELSAIVEQFKEDAAGQGLTLEQALNKQLGSSEAFNQQRGTSMVNHINRFENLRSQRESMIAADPLVRPVHLFRYPDSELLSGTLNDYKPGIQLSFEGLIWGLIGGGFALFLGRLPISATRRSSKTRRAPKVSPENYMPSVQVDNKTPFVDRLAGPDPDRMARILVNQPTNRS